MKATLSEIKSLACGSILERVDDFKRSSIAFVRPSGPSASLAIGIHSTEKWAIPILIRMSAFFERTILRRASFIIVRFIGAGKIAQWLHWSQVSIDKRFDELRGVSVFTVKTRRVHLQNTAVGPKP